MLSNFCLNLLFITSAFLSALCLGDNACGNQTLNLPVGVESNYQFRGYPEITGSTYLDCWYTVQSQNGTRIRFWFDSFGIAIYGERFYIWVYNGQRTSSDRFLIVNQESQIGIMYHSNSSVMSFNLRVPKSYTYTGIQFRAMAVASCGSRLEAIEDPQELFPPGYPFRHLPNQICTWPIIAGPDHVIEITPNLISNETCCDHVQIIESGTTLKQGKKYLSTNNYLRLLFIAENSVLRNPFELSYRSVYLCGEMPQLSTINNVVTFQAQPFPVSKSGQYICVFTLVAPTGTRIRFWFDDFGMKTFSNETFLLFYDGLSQNNHQFLTLNQLNQTFTLFHSKSNAMVIRNIIYKSSNYSGFVMKYEAVESSSCGACHIATDNKKILTSPGFPALHASNYICSWILIVPRGFVVEIEITFISSESCCIHVEAVEMVPYRIATRLNTSQAYYSIGDQVTINFVANHSLERNGFQLSYRKAPCGSPLLATKDLQILTSPNFPQMHLENQRCLWSITSQPNFVIEVIVSNVTKESCCSNLQVRIPNPSQIISLNNNQQSLISPGTTITVEFFANKSVHRSGFSLGYKAIPVCGNDSFRAELDVYKILKPPAYPPAKSDIMSCRYVITAGEGKIIRFWVFDFGTRDIGSSSYYLQFANNLVRGSIFLTLNNTNQTHTMYHSSSNQLLVMSNVQRTYNYTGFTIQYTAVDVCGTALSAVKEVQYLSSNFPRQYRNNLICSWPISTFTDYLIKVEGIFVSNDTCCEQLQVPGSTNSTIRTGQAYTTTGNSLTVGFVSNNSSMKRGFNITFQAVHVCGVLEFIAEHNVEKTLDSPYFGSFSTSKYCWYTITSPNNTRVRFWIEELGVREFNSLFSVKFYNSVRLYGDPFLSVQDNTTLNMMHNSRFNYLGIRLQIYRSYYQPSFKMRYMAVDACGETIFALRKPKELSIPSYSGQYFSNVTCTWTIRAPLAHVIQITTGLVSNNTCCERAEILFSSKVFLATNQTYRTPGPSVVLDFVSNHSNELMGFYLQYKAVSICGLHEYLAEVDTEKVINPPIYPQLYRNEMYCSYSIYAPESTRIRFWVDELETSSQYLRFYDEITITGAWFLELNPYSKLGKMYHSLSNFLGIYRYTTKSYGNSGFILRYMAVDECGTSVFALPEVQTISTPGFPRSYRSNLFCNWTIAAPSRQNIILETYFTSNETCCRTLEMTIGSSKTFLEPNKTYYSGIELISIQFTSNSTERFGVKLDYKSINICGEKEMFAVLDTEKSLQLPQYPGNYPQTLHCYFSIIAPSEKRIRFWVENFGLGSGSLYLYFYNNLPQSSSNFLTINDRSPAMTLHHSLSHILGIRLDSSKTYNYTNFKLNYMAVDWCEANIKATERLEMLAIPNYPQQYKHNLTCEWTISSIPSVQYIMKIITGRIYNETVQMTTSSSILLKSNTEYFIPSDTTAKFKLVSNGLNNSTQFHLQYQAVSICGILKFSAELDVEKLLHPPAFPQFYEDYMNCWYTISSPRYTRIRFWVESFGIQREPSGHAYLWFYNNLIVGSQRDLIVDSSSQLGVMYHSKSNAMGIKLRTYKPYNYTGFILRYVAVEWCGQNNLIATYLTQDIYTVDYPSYNDHNMTCEWTIRTRDNEHIIKITTENIGNATCCERTVMETQSTKALTSNQTYLTPGNSARILFVSNSRKKIIGFKASYQAAPICGETEYNAELDVEKLINPPAYPEAYSTSYRYCWYSIVSPESTVIRFWVEDFGTENFANYLLRFYNTLQEKSGGLFLTLRQTSALNVMRHSPLNLMGIKLQVYLPHGYEGLRVRYMAVDYCGSSLTASETARYITTPNYPNQYRFNLTCRWTITSPPADYYVVQLLTRDINNETCCERAKMHSTILLSPNHFYQNLGRSVSIDFVSNSSQKRKGFAVEYKAASICGESNFTAEIDRVKVLEPPPNLSYAHGRLNCWYAVEAPQGTKIWFWVDKISYQDGYRGNFQLTFYNSLQHPYSRFLQITYTSTLSARQTSPSNVMRIKLEGITYGTYTGFFMRFSAVETCGSNLKAVEKIQTVTTPNFPSSYRSNISCTWSITTQSQDYQLKVFTGYVSDDRCCENLRSSYVGRLYSNNIYSILRDSDTIYFDSTNSSVRRGFTLQYKAEYVCGLTTAQAEVDVSKQFVAPGFPTNYPSDYVSCSYIITAPKSTIIRFWFTRIGYVRRQSKSQLQIQLTDMQNPSRVFETIYERTNRRFSSPSNRLRVYVRGYGRSPVYYSGFTMNYYAALSCGSRLIAQDQWTNLSTPDYPHPYQHNMTCDWTITTPSNYFVQINNVVVSRETCCEKLEIKSPTSRRLSTGSSYTTSYNRHLYLQFTADHSRQQQGFTLQYKRAPICGNSNFQAQLYVTSRLYAAGFPSGFHLYSYMNCYYTMTAPAGTRIRFWITSFGISPYTPSHFRILFYDGYNRVNTYFLEISHTNQVGLMFHSKHNVMSFHSRVYYHRRYRHRRYTYYPYSGFRMNYEAVDSCGTILEALETSQALRQPAYAADRICNWTIRAPSDHKIMVSPTQVFRQSLQDRIRTGNQLFIVESGSGKLYLSRTSYLSPTNKMEINFVSNSSDGRNSFSFLYQAVHICGRKQQLAQVQSNYQTFHPPSFSFNDRSVLDCQYTFRSPEGTRIFFYFTSFGINRYGSSYFSIQIYDGLSIQNNHFLTLYSSGHRYNIHHSPDNIMTLIVRATNSITYTGFQMQYRAVAIERDSYLNIRVNFTSIYAVVANRQMKEKYLLDDFDTVDVSEEILTQMRADSRIPPQFVNEETELGSGFFSGSRTLIRVDLKWTFALFLENSTIHQYALHTDRVNDVTLLLFAVIREQSDLTQLTRVNLEVPQVDASSVIVQIRVDFLRNYRALILNTVSNYFKLQQTTTNDLSSQMFDEFLNNVTYAQLFQIDQTAPTARGVHLLVKVDRLRTYSVVVPEIIVSNYQFIVNETNEISEDIFNQLREVSESVQLLETKELELDETPITIRVNYTKVYQMLLPQSAILYYNINPNVTNDVHESIFLLMEPQSPYYQLISYRPYVPSLPSVTIRVDFEKTYHVALPQSVRNLYSLTADQINDVTDDVFDDIISDAEAVQLISVDLFKVQSNGTFITFRADFSRYYTTNISHNALEEYAILADATNDVTGDMLRKITEKYGVELQLNRVDTVLPTGYLVNARVNRSRIYNLYMPRSVAVEYDLLSSPIVDLNDKIFMMILRQSNHYQLRQTVETNPLEGVKIRVRVGSRIYDVYVSDETKLKYRLHLKRINEISNTTLDQIQADAYFMQFVDVVQPKVINEKPYRVRVNYNLIYDVYVPDDVKDQYNLKSNVTNEISEALFNRIQHYATNVELLEVLTKDITTKNKYTIRVDYDNVYEVFLNDSDASKFPLTFGKTNDITSQLFKEIQKSAVLIQLVSLHNNPVTVTIRVGMKWVYRLIILDSARMKYNLELNKTNDVSNSIFTSLREQASSLQLISDEPQDLGNTTSVDVLVNSSLTYKVFVDPAKINEFNLTTNKTNNLSTNTFTNLTTDEVVKQLVGVKITDDSAICPSNNWTIWFNRDDPLGKCDCETLPELRREYPGLICEKPTTFEARLENCRIPYDPTLSNIVANLVVGFRCNNEPGRTCLDYEVRFCCP